MLRSHTAPLGFAGFPAPGFWFPSRPGFCFRVVRVTGFPASLTVTVRRIKIEAQAMSIKDSAPPAARESVFTVEATPLKFGAGASAEAGWELQRLGVTRAMVVCDPGVRRAGLVEPICDQFRAHGIEFEVYDEIYVEPTDASFAAAGAAAREGGFDGFVSIGGGSTIDTAKVANLLATHGGEVIEYVNPPVGAGRKPDAPLRPHLAIPTTAGTGSEATTVAVLDLPELKVKSGISHRYLRPSQAIVDPELSRTMPAAVTSSAGLDVVCHAAESYISRPFDTRPRPATPADRPPYQGANPVADLCRRAPWSTAANTCAARSPTARMSRRAGS